MSIIWESQVLLKNFAAHMRSDWTKPYWMYKSQRYSCVLYLGEGGGEKMIRAKLTEVRQLVADQVTDEHAHQHINTKIDELESLVVATLRGDKFVREVTTEEDDDGLNEED